MSKLRKQCPGHSPNACGTPRLCLEGLKLTSSVSPSALCGAVSGEVSLCECRLDQKENWGAAHRQKLEAGVAGVLQGSMHAPQGRPVEGESDMHQLRGPPVL